MKKKDIKLEINKEEMMKKGSKTISEFKEFIARGNVVELAVGVVMGKTFSEIVTSLVNNIIMPLVGVAIGGIDFSNLSIKVGEATITYGKFIQSIIDFLIIAVCIFVMVKVIEKFTKKKEEKTEEVVEEVKQEEKRDEQVVLLEEIRNLLKYQTK